jgi:hypothetical protein
MSNLGKCAIVKSIQIWCRTMVVAISWAVCAALYWRLSCGCIYGDLSYTLH